MRRILGIMGLVAVVALAILAGETVYADGTPTATPTATSTVLTPSVRFVNPYDGSSGGIPGYLNPASANLSVTGVGANFQLSLVRTSTGEIVASRTYTLSQWSATNPWGICLFGLDQNAQCAAWPDQQFIDGEYVFTATAVGSTTSVTDQRTVRVSRTTVSLATYTPTPTTRPAASVSMSYSCSIGDQYKTGNHVDVTIHAAAPFPASGYWIKVSDSSKTIHITGGSSGIGWAANPVLHETATSVWGEGSIDLVPGGTYTITVVEGVPANGDWFTSVPATENLLVSGTFTIGPCVWLTATPTPTQIGTSTPTSTATPAVPRITSVSPIVAKPGDLVIIQGENFLVPDTDVSSLAVWLVHDDGGVNTLATVIPYSQAGWYQNSISFRIRDNEVNQSGFIYVHVNGRWGRWDQRFTIWDGPTPTPTVTETPYPTPIPPVITQVTPMEAEPGQQVVVRGQNFRTERDNSLYVWLERDGSAIELAHFNPEYNNQNWTNGVITFTVPGLSTRSGSIRVDVRFRSAYADGTFIILPVVTPTPVPTVEQIPFPPTCVDISFENGWNLISIPSGNSAYTARSLSAELQSRGIEVRQIASWENGAWRSYVPGHPTDGFAIRPGKGYFVRVTAPGTWYPGCQG